MKVKLKRHISKILLATVLTTTMGAAVPTYKVTAEEVKYEDGNGQTKLNELLPTIEPELIEIQITDEKDSTTGSAGVRNVKVTKENVPVPIEGNDNTESHIKEGTKTGDRKLNGYDSTLTADFKATSNGDYTITTQDGTTDNPSEDGSNPNESTTVLRISNIFTSGNDSIVNLSMKDITDLDTNPRSTTNKPHEVTIEATPSHWTKYKNGDTVNTISSMKLIKIEYDETQKLKRKDETDLSQNLGGVDVKLKVDLPQKPTEGFKKSTIKFIATQSADYTFEVIDQSGNKGEITIPINHIDHRNPKIDTDKETTMNNLLKIWTNNSSEKGQDFEIAFKSPSNTFHDAVVEDDNNPNIVFDTTHKSGSSDGLVITKDSAGEGIATVRFKVKENGTYNITVRDDVTTVTQKIIVSNFDRNKPSIELSASSSGLKYQNPYGETGSPTTEMPIEP